MDDCERQDLKRFTDRWRQAGPALENQRLEEVSALSDEQARCITLDLFALWRQLDHDPFGAGLVEQQRVFQLWQARVQDRP